MALTEPDAPLLERTGTQIIRLPIVGSPNRNGDLQDWLSTQCPKLPGSRSGLVAEIHEGKRNAIVAQWPSTVRDLGRLTKALDQAIASNRPVISKQTENELNGAAHLFASPISIAIPVFAAGRMAFCVAIELTTTSDSDLPGILEQVRWSTGWLQAIALNRLQQEQTASLERTASLLDLITAVQEKPGLKTATAILVNELAARLSCSRVSIGFRKGDRVRVYTISHVADFRKSSQVIIRLAEAMTEAMDQRDRICFPPLANERSKIVLFHRNLAASSQSHAIVSLPLRSRGETFAIVTLERQYPKTDFKPGEILFLEAAAALLGPAVDEKRAADKLLTGRLFKLLKRGTRLFTGERHLAIKFAALFALLTGVALATAKDEFRISAKAVLEGSIQRAIVAPFEGFIGSALVRAGDEVTANQVIATLDDREPALEKFRLLSEKEKLQQKLREAQAKFERSNSASLAAQVRQVDAQLRLAIDKLARTHLKAPIAGLVVSGDLSQMIGSPVERGRVLFEIAPLNSYRVALQVDEADIGYVSVGKNGTLLLTGITGARLPFTITKVTSISTPQDGRNYFRVEADLKPSDASLRPGMQGVAKVEIDEQPLVWVWGRSTIERIRLLLWSALP